MKPDCKMTTEKEIPRLLSTEELVTYLAGRFGISLSEASLKKYRASGEGPAFVAFGARILYDPKSVDLWVRNRMSNPVTKIESIVGRSRAARKKAATSRAPQLDMLEARDE